MRTPDEILKDENETLRYRARTLEALIDRGANAWLALQRDHPIQWEGDLADAMIAACNRIRELESAPRVRVVDAVSRLEDAISAGHGVALAFTKMKAALAYGDPDAPETGRGEALAALTHDETQSAGDSYVTITLDTAAKIRAALTDADAGVDRG